MGLLNFVNSRTVEDVQWRSCTRNNANAHILFCGTCLCIMLYLTSQFIPSNIRFVRDACTDLVRKQNGTHARTHARTHAQTHARTLCTTNHCIGSLSDIALFLRSAQIPTKHSHPSNQHICNHRSLLIDSLDRYCHLIII